MKVSLLIGLLESMLKSQGDVVVSACLYFKDDVAFLADRELSDSEWAWLSQDIMSNWVLQSRDLESYIEALDDAVKSGEVGNE